ncbi:MAG TPA: PIN domain-containing protein [Gemmatimonadales bacterium]|nr:PIN domain-containing protein [Gemmatimonadales bacterium]
MAKYSLDTNIYIDALRDPNERAALRDFNSWALPSTYLSAVVILELEAGASAPPQAQALDQLFIAPFERRQRVLIPSPVAWRSTGQAIATLRRTSGQAAPAFQLIHDILLAFSCREHGITLITRDSDFRTVARLVPGLRVTSPWPKRPRGA